MKREPSGPAEQGARLGRLERAFVAVRPVAQILGGRPEETTPGEGQTIWRGHTWERSTT